MATNARGQRCSARILRQRRGVWLARYRIDGMPAWTDIEPSLKRHRALLARAMNQGCMTLTEESEHG